MIRLGSAVAVRDGDKLLLARRNKEPEKGKWVLPGGGVQPFETIREAAHREVLEETGLEIEVGKQIGIYELIQAPHEHRVIVYHWASRRGGALRASGDSSEVRFFSIPEIRELPLTPLMQIVLRDIGWLER